MVSLSSMRLGDYLATNKISATEFASRIDATQAAVSRYVTGKRIPEPAIMAKIVQVTDGAVTPNDFYAPELERTE